MRGRLIGLKLDLQETEFTKIHVIDQFDRLGRPHRNAGGAVVGRRIAGSWLLLILTR